MRATKGTVNMFVDTEFEFTDKQKEVVRYIIQSVCRFLYNDPHTAVFVLQCVDRQTIHPDIIEYLVDSITRNDIAFYSDLAKKDYSTPISIRRDHLISIRWQRNQSTGELKDVFTYFYQMRNRLDSKYFGYNPLLIEQSTVISRVLFEFVKKPHLIHREPLVSSEEKNS